MDEAKVTFTLMIASLTNQCLNLAGFIAIVGDNKRSPAVLAIFAKHNIFNYFIE